MQRRRAFQVVLHIAALATSFCISSQKVFISSLLPGLARNFTTIVSVLAGRAAGLAAWGSAAANGRVRAMSAEVRVLALRHQREIGFLP